MNRLSEANSAYLKHAADQKIDWYQWSEEPFQRAQKEDKPLFLSSGGVWCHWCHVMAQESFHSDEVAEILNKNFICIKIDRDERPDIDKRYQMAVHAMDSSGGWPLSVFLTPEKKPFYGGTYFPPEDRMGKPGFKKVLHAVLELYKSKKEDIDAYTGRLISALRYSPSTSGEIDQSFFAIASEKIIGEFDAHHGGFGSAPKFPMPGAIEYLINRFYLTRESSYAYVVRKTLESMARGGCYDQIGGGFHRYSTDRAWIIPHFEKMGDDNALLLKNYLYAYSVLGDELFKNISTGIIAFVRDVLSDPAGGFYSSQDADVTPDDEGGYFTWTRDDFKRVLTKDEQEILSLHFLHDSGSMHHDPSKKVLFEVMDEKAIADMTGRDLNDVIHLIKGGKAKLLNERSRRQAPFVDKTMYTSINGMFISSFLVGYRILRDPMLREFAISSLEKIISLRFVDEELYHADGVNAFLDDYAYLIDALIAAYEVTGNASYATLAEKLLNICIDRLWDKEGGGFFDSATDILEMRIKNIDDIPHPSANALCIRLLLKFYSLKENEMYRSYAEQALKSFALNARESGIYVSSYFCALDAFYHSMKLTLYTSAESELSREAMMTFRPYVDLIYREDRGYIIPCSQQVCYNSINTPKELKDFIQAKSK